MLINLVASIILGFIIGFERESNGKAVGTRTISLIALGAALFVSLSPTIIGGDNSRIVAQVVSGIGFLGAGIIFKDGNTVRGLTTAATIWCSAAIGCLCGAGLFKEAVIGTAGILFINTVFKYIKHNKENDEQE
jgi:putative Mg2+ transporter-C (MgtC) family protein